MQLEKLLRKAAAADKTSWSRDAVEERRLRAEQDRLAVQEAKAAERLAKLQSALDRVTTELSAVIERRAAASMFEPNDHSADEYMLTYSARRAVNVLHSGFKRKLAKFDAAGITPASLEWHFKTFIEADHPALFAPPEPAVDHAAIEQARLDERRTRTAKAILDSGRLRRGEHVDANGIINLASFRETKKDK